MSAEEGEGEGRRAKSNTCSSKGPSSSLHGSVWQWTDALGAAREGGEDNSSAAGGDDTKRFQVISSIPLLWKSLQNFKYSYCSY